ncbi:sulfatase-like hydrolase/transferase [Phycisphaeraceae bacterium D3-23]
MKIHRPIATLAALALTLLFAPRAAAQQGAAAPPPNILLIIADDMGYGDLGCTGTAVIQTPHLDALAADGRLCDQAYVTSSVCAPPSRSGLITGRHPCRIGFETNLNAHWDEETTHTRQVFYGLHPSEATLADHLRANGYHTGAVGKWHLGMFDEHYPTERGFDYFCGMRGGGHTYFLNRGRNQIERNGEAVTEFSSNYVTDFFTDEAIGFIERTMLFAQRGERGTNPPWFLYLAYNAPHTPMQATDADLAHYAHIENEKRRTYCAMVHALDRGIGRVVEHLKATGQYDNTLIIFFSDNGGARNTNASWNGVLSGSKGNLREGGVRVPFIATWPDRIPAGDTTYNGVVSTLDLLPTLLAACGGEALELTDGSGRNEQPRIYDGINILDHLITGEPTPDRALFWRLQGQAAVLVNGNDKLIRLAHRPAQLFTLATDLGESTDMAHKHLDRTEELYRLLFDFERSMPTFQHFQTLPYWFGPSAKNYDEYVPVEEPR